jgi:heat shock protein HslJ/membrane-bound inhibitor of C-type lysozyme
MALLALLLAGGMPAGYAQSKATYTEQVQFGSGKASAVRQGSIRGYATRDYVLEAREGQKMTVELDSKSTFLYFNVIDPETKVSIDADPRPMEVTTWSGTLPKTGKYAVRVFLVRAEARRGRTAAYTITMAIDNPATGANDAVTYTCDGNGEILAVYNLGDSASARIEVGDSSWTLPAALSASGSKYSDGKVTFWSKGDEAIFEGPIRKMVCLAVDDNATTKAGLESGAWRLDSIARDGEWQDVPDGAAITATFKDGRVAGKGICNNYFATYTVSDKANLAIGAVGATKMMCARNADFEGAFFKSLGATTRFAISGATLMLTNGEGGLLFQKP